MPTGACGINCDFCKLRLLKICSSCGSGRSPEAASKLEIQRRLFGTTCTILDCAVTNRLGYCPRDCNEFPCENFSKGRYPYSEGFLNMQKRRRRQIPPALDHNGRPVRVPSEYWDKLEARDINKLCNLTLAEPRPPAGLIFESLGDKIHVDIRDRKLRSMKGGLDKDMDHPMLELITLLYLNGVETIYPLGKDIIGVKDLKEAHFFKGPHALDLQSLTERYGEDMEGFIRACKYIGGTPLEMADSAFKLLPFPRVPLYYLFRKGDEEFNPDIAVLFDRSVEQLFSASGIWGLVSLVTTALLIGPVNPMLGDT